MHVKRWIAIGALVALVIVGIAVLHECAKEKYWISAEEHRAQPGDYRRVVMEWIDGNTKFLNVQIYEWDESVVRQVTRHDSTLIFDGRHTGLTQVYVAIRHNASLKEADRWNWEGERYYFIIKDDEVIEWRYALPRIIE